jgi:hypothetical protein
MVDPLDPGRGQSWWDLFTRIGQRLEDDVQTLWPILEHGDLDDDEWTGCLLAMSALTQARKQLDRAAEFGRQLVRS